MKTVYAEINQGRWIIHCPDFPDAHATEVNPNSDKTYICGACYQDKDGSARRYPDASAQARASKSDKVYSITYPADIPAILDALRYRPTPNMNWTPGESIQYLQADNIAHGIGVETTQATTVKGVKIK
jgi:hypothetical protein